MKKIKFSPKIYKAKNPKKANLIKRAVKRGVKEYEETFKRLATI
jgi:hypothetical protein